LKNLTNIYSLKKDLILVIFINLNNDYE
jgi:hypothetical protein